MTDKQKESVLRAKNVFLNQLKTISKQLKNNQEVNDEIILEIDTEIDRFITWNEEIKQ